MPCGNLIKIALPGLNRIKRKICQKDTKQHRLLKFFFESWCPGGGNALGQNEVDPTLESTKLLTATLGIKTE